MSTIFCQKLKKEGEIIKVMTYQGELGQKIKDNFCQRSMDDVVKISNNAYKRK